MSKTAFPLHFRSRWCQMIGSARRSRCRTSISQAISGPALVPLVTCAGTWRRMNWTSTPRMVRSSRTTQRVWWVWQTGKECDKIKQEVMYVPKLQTQIFGFITEQPMQLTLPCHEHIVCFPDMSLLGRVTQVHQRPPKCSWWPVLAFFKNRFVFYPSERTTAFTIDYAIM